MKSQRSAVPSVTLAPWVQSRSSRFQNGWGSGWVTRVPGGTGNTSGSAGTGSPIQVGGSPTPSGPPVVGDSFVRMAMSSALIGRFTTRSLRKMTFLCQLVASGVEVFS